MALRSFMLVAAGALVAAACGGERGSSARSDTAATSGVAAQDVSPGSDSSAATNNVASGTAARSAQAPAPSRTRTASDAKAASPAAITGAAAPRSAPRRQMIADLDVTDLGYDVGNRNAPVVVINFSDFGCPYCGQFTHETYPTLEREYVRTGKVLFKYVPFVAGMFPNGEQAARAAECAADQGRFWEMHDRLYAQQAEWKRTREPLALLQGYAATLGLDRAAFDGCYAAQRVHPRTRRANEIASEIGVRVTPSFLVNDRPVEGALPLAQFRRIIDAALLLSEVRP